MPAAPAPVSWPALNVEFLAAAAATYNFTLGRPVPLGITPDGAVLFRRTSARSFSSDLFLIHGGEVRTLATVDSLLGACTMTNNCDFLPQLHNNFLILCSS